MYVCCCGVHAIIFLKDFTLCPLVLSLFSKLISICTRTESCHLVLSPPCLMIWGIKKDSVSGSTAMGQMISSTGWPFLHDLKAN